MSSIIFTFSAGKNKRRSTALALILLVALLLLGGVLFASFRRAHAQNSNLSVEINAAYNLVVDSNVSSPSTYAPSVATVSGKFCNDGATDLNNVYGYIGDYVNDTPGIYPARTVDAAFTTEHPALDNPGAYSFTHVGGRIGAADATRYLGDIPAGECVVQYWHFSYPQCENDAGGNPTYPPCTTDPTWGDSVKPEDDLWLEFDVWAEGNDAGDGAPRTANTSWRMTMRNEISAMANKIEPNPSGRWFNTDEQTIRPGQVITSNGVLYELGNINQGFDNNEDYVPDYNAWLQPIGDPAYDPSCFRLIRTTGVLTVSRSSGQPDMYIPFQDQLYFTDLPANNTGVTGSVRYAFLALDGPCATSLTPYQEVASGFDNEKFNADFGAGIPPIAVEEAQVTIDKSSSPSTVPQGTQYNYTIPFQNEGATSSPSLPLSSGALPLVISDTIPAGVQFDGAGYTLSSSGAVSIIYSTDGGATWSDTAPAGQISNGDIVVQWWLDQPLPAGESGSATLQVTVPSGYLTGGGDPFIENCADSRFGNGAPFDQACTTTLVEGNNSLGDYVWQDDDSDGGADTGEAPLANIGVTLYWDQNGDGRLDDGDTFVATTNSDAGGNYSFTSLPDGNYIVVVDTEDADIPQGYHATTAEQYAVALDPNSLDANPVADLDNDFGFGPVLALRKSLASGDPAYEGGELTYTITLTNTRPGDGSGQASSCQYTAWGETISTTYSGTGNAAWSPATNALGTPDGAYAASEFANALEEIGLTDFFIGSRSGSVTNVDVLVALSVVNPGAFRVSPADSLDLNVIDTNSGSTIYTQSYPPTVLNTWSGVFVEEVILPAGVVGGMSIADFNGNRYVVQLVANGGGGNNSTYPAYLDLDAAGFRVTTSEECGGVDDTIDPLPLSDTFDDSVLQFVSAEPAASGVSGNTISWDNVGPLYAGQTKVVTVTMRAIAPVSPATACVPHTNTGSVSGATFAGGGAVNDAGDTAVHDVCPAGSIGDLVWNDIDGDGAYDPNGADAAPGTPDDENGIPGVTVYLCLSTATPCNAANALETAVTDADGAYLFAGLGDGSYVTAVDAGALPDGGAGASNTADYDGDTDSDSGAIVINNSDGDPGNDDVLDADFGYTIPAMIEGAIWHDRDQSGADTADPGEESLAGVTVYLDDGACTIGVNCPSTTTDANGEYTFSGLTPAAAGAAYTVVVDPTTGDMSTPTWNQSFDSDGAGTAEQVSVTLVPGGYGRADYSYYQTGNSTIGDYLWQDWDGDGVQDGGEAGIPNVTVYLYEDSNGDGVIDPDADALIAGDVTDANGGYLFENLPAGDYVVVVDEDDPDLPGLYVQTYDPDESAPCATCDATDSSTVDGTAGGSDDTVDFGYQPTGAGAIGDFIWLDDNGDGFYDTGESGVSGVTVDLYVDANNDGLIDGGDAYVGSQTTDADGYYLFPNLPAGDYLVDVPTSVTVGVDAYYLSSNELPPDPNGGVNGPDNDPFDVALSAGESYLDADFGYATGGAIGDYIWQDDDGDGSQDTAEPGIENVTVTLYVDNDRDGVVSTGDAVYDTTQTDADGLYEFTDLPPDYYVAAVDESSAALSGFTQTGDPDETGGCTSCDAQSGLELDPGQIDRSRDFGYMPPGVLGDFVWVDGDGDGVQDPGEQGVGGVVITLTLQSGAVLTTTTDSDGYYAFGDVPDGNHTVTVDSDSLPAGLTQTYDVDGALDNTTTLVMSGGSVTQLGGSACANCDYDADFGYRYFGDNDVSGAAFHDDNDNATIDMGEDVRYSAVTIYLYRLDDGGDGTCDDGNESVIGLVGATTTDTNGNYSFGALADGCYVVSVNDEAPNLTGADPTVTGTPTTFHIVDLDANGDNPGGESSTGNDFGFLSQIDMGDLPAGYGVTDLNEDGARHTAGDVYLGVAVGDTEPNGQPSLDASGDGADEDGVTTGLGPDGDNDWDNGANGGSLEITISGGGWLVGWIDFNEDGDFDDAGEMVIDQAVSDTGGAAQNFQIDVPANTFCPDNDPGCTTAVTPDYLHARFRLFTEQPFNSAAAYTGLAENGEVEDYRWGQVGPTAVSLRAFHSAPTAVSLTTLLLTLGLALFTGFILRRR